MRIARKQVGTRGIHVLGLIRLVIQHGMSTMKPKDDAMNRLLVIKDSPTERLVVHTALPRG